VEVPPVSRRLGESFRGWRRLPGPKAADLVRAIIAFPTVVVLDPAMLLRALEVYEVDRLDFADADLVAQADVRGLAWSPRSTRRSTA